MLLALFVGLFVELCAYERVRAEARHRLRHF